MHMLAIFACKHWHMCVYSCYLSLPPPLFLPIINKHILKRKLPTILLSGILYFIIQIKEKSKNKKTLPTVLLNPTVPEDKMKNYWFKKGYIQAGDPVH